MDQMLEQVRHFASTTDKAGRKRLALALRDVSYALETPDDTTARITSYSLRAAAVRTGIDLKLFTYLTTTESPLSTASLAEKTGADVSFIGRYLRCLASFGFIMETSKDTFAANSVTRAIDDSGRQAEMIHFFDVAGQAFQAMPEFHRSHRFKDPDAADDGPFQLAFKTSKTAFDFMPELPQHTSEAFYKYMEARTRYSKSWLSTYPFLQEIGQSGPDDVVFVDVGGGFGHQCLDLRKTFPDLQGRVVLQDLQYPVDTRLKDAGVEGMVHDAFKPQPIQGARFYYLRNVLHDWPDAHCASILVNLKDAMDARSRILIDELVLPDQGVHWAATTIDLTMMASHAAKERTETQWKHVLDEASLEVERLWRYEGRVGYEGVMAVRRKE